ncbi:dUTP diphosphatase [Terriglobus roseus]|uniref:dUTP diphosphatase n=1 Tax=Terriglobus roseus TaxID=392734 RepID=A0A1H4PK80_9BACT|nr:dUTP diphosphatase [Terriglobus roseus]SEC07532.1 deoxyuridine 5'-triphosphate nucleotidohydrolase [Terriglobus roseus]
MESGLHVPVKRLHPEAKLPKYAHTGPFGDLAADLYSVAGAYIEPHKTALVPTGIAMAFPAEYGALIEDRSGLAVKGITTLAGVIDPGYRGEIKVVLINITDAPIALNAGDRIAQLRMVRKIEATFVEVEDLDDTHRGDGGFGSTGS